MTPSNLIRRSLRHYWRTNLRRHRWRGRRSLGSSRGAARGRFGSWQPAGFVSWPAWAVPALVLSASHFFPEDLPAASSDQPDFQAQFERLCPLIVTQGVVTHQESRRRASEVQVYGVDERFWRFHDQSASAAFEMSQREALVSQPLATEIGIQPGDSILLRLEASFGYSGRVVARKTGEPGTHSTSHNARGIAVRGLGEFSLKAEQQSVKAIFVPLGRLQKEIDQVWQDQQRALRRRQRRFRTPGKRRCCRSLSV